jgi:hypothetical protein
VTRGAHARHGLALLAAATLLTACKEPPEDAARALTTQGDFSKALPLLRVLIDEQPDRPDLQLFYTQALIGNRDRSLAVWPLRKSW